MIDDSLEIVTKGHTQTFFLKCKTRQEAEFLKNIIEKNKEITQNVLDLNFDYFYKLCSGTDPYVSLQELKKKLLGIKN